jgi:Lrp/AsnC family transcriptional regulator for asnA, asnC and gidA
VVCADDEDLLRVLHEVREVPGVVGTDTFVYLKLRKQSYAWGAG